MSPLSAAKDAVPGNGAQQNLSGLAGPSSQSTAVSGWALGS